MKTILGSLLALGLMASAASAQCAYGGHPQKVAKVEKPVDVTPAQPAPAPVEAAPVQPAPAPVPQK